MARVPAGPELIENRMSGAPGIRRGNIFIMAGVPHITAGMLDALGGTLEGGRPVLYVTGGCWVADGGGPDLRGHTARHHEGRPTGRHTLERQSHGLGKGWSVSIG